MTKPFDVAKFRKGLTKGITGISTGFNDPKIWLSTGSYGLNYLISGDFYKGVPMGKVTVFAGESGCLPATARVEILVDDVYRNTTVEDMRTAYRLGSKIKVRTPEGYVTVSEWFDKGIMSTVTVQVASGLITNCATGHLLQRGADWVEAGDLKIGDTLVTQHNSSDVVTSIVESTTKECFDFTVTHEAHSYWGDGFASHNSGKSYIVSGNIVKSAQDQGIFVVLIDSENALDKQWLENLGVSTEDDKLLRVSASMIDDVAKIINDFVKEYKDNYLDIPHDDRPKVLFVVDSLGMLLSATEVNQFAAGDMKGDMGRKAKQLKALVTNCVNMFGDLDIGMVVTNHTYASQDMFDPDDKISGGCLIPGTLVSTVNGMVAIQDLKEGDVVHTLDGPSEVAKTFTFEKETFSLEMEDGTVFTASAEHRFMVRTADGYVWKTVGQLEAGESIIQCLNPN